jgi:F-type H+-transporting ATPase subunit b
LVALNFTVIVEMFLFVVFLWVTNRFIFQPLLRLIDDRNAKLNEDRTGASNDTAEAQRIEAEYTQSLTQAHTAAAQRLRQARYEAYQHNRDEMDRLRQQSDDEIVEFRQSLLDTLTVERQQYPGLINGLVENMDKWVRDGGIMR